MADSMKCFLCDGDLGKRPEDSWCYGCKRYICDLHGTVFDRHVPDEHDREYDYSD